jgi:hypothetical protein
LTNPFQSAIIKIPKEKEIQKMRIEITNEIEKAITMACPVPAGDDRNCFGKCALAGACLEYWTGDNSENKEEKA